MAILSRMYPCKECADHFKEVLRYILSPPPPSSFLMKNWSLQYYSKVVSFKARLLFKREQRTCTSVKYPSFEGFPVRGCIHGCIYMFSMWISWPLKLLWNEWSTGITNLFRQKWKLFLSFSFFFKKKKIWS